MGRGRAKAKQTKVARELKYSSPTMDLDALISQSLLQQTRVAANDSLGLCIFGMSVTNPNTEFLTTAINAALDGLEHFSDDVRVVIVL